MIRGLTWCETASHGPMWPLNCTNDNSLPFHSAPNLPPAAAPSLRLRVGGALGTSGHIHRDHFKTGTPLFEERNMGQQE